MTSFELCKTLVISSLMLAGSSASAFFIQGDAFYFTENLNAGANNSSSQTFADIAMGFDVDTKGRYQIGWAYGLYSTSSTSAGVNTSYASTMTGPKFLFYLGRDKTWNIGLTYGVLSDATYTTAGASHDHWRGTSYKIEAGYVFRLGSDGSNNLGLDVNYLAANYSDDFVGGSDYTKVSYSKTAIFPSLTYILRF